MKKTNDLKDAIRPYNGIPILVLENHYKGLQEYNYCPWHPGNGPCSPDEYTVAVWRITPKEAKND